MARQAANRLGGQRQRRPRWWLAAVGFGLLLGCGSSGPFDYVPVSGRVVFDDGEPLGVGRVIFSPQAPPTNGAHPKSGQAFLQPDGTFTSATTYKPGDGIIPGQHKVSFIYATNEAGELLVPEAYTSSLTTPLTVHSDDRPFEIVVQRPD